MQDSGIALCRVTVGKSVIVEINSKQSINYQVILLHCIVSKLCRDTLDLMRVFCIVSGCSLIGSTCNWLY